MKGVPLRDGRPLAIHLYQPGVVEPPAPLERLRDLIVQPVQPWFGADGRDYVERGLWGRIADVNVDYYFVGAVGGELAGAVWYQVSRRCADVGAFGYVWTEPAFRGQGVGHALSAAAVEHFTARGGLALYLGTTNPVANRVYERVGFRDYNGVAMRYVAPPRDPELFDAELFADLGPAVVRPIDWGDAGLIDATYCAPLPWLIRDYDLRSFSHPKVRQARCHIFPTIVSRLDGKGGIGLVLENPRGRVVGSTLLARGDARLESHVGTADFVVRPAYVHQAGELLSALVDAAAARGISLVQLTLASIDDDKREVARAAGFDREAVLPGRLDLAGERLDLEVWRRGA